MSPHLFSIFFLAGALALAFWFDARFPGLAPASLRSAVLHVGCTMLAAQIVFPVATHLFAGSRLLGLLSAFGIGLPALTYTLLAGIWIVRLAHEGLGGRLR